MKKILIFLTVLMVSCVGDVEPVKVKPNRYGKIICTSHKFKDADTQKRMTIVFKAFDVTKFAKLENFERAWIQAAGGHADLISKYYKKLTTDTNYENQSPVERLLILKSFKEGLTCYGN